MQGITSSRFRMTPIFLISVRTASTHTGTYTARNLHSKITAISKGTCHKSQRTSSAKFCCVPCPSASAHAINLPYSYRCQSRPSRKQYKFTLQLNATLLKGRMHTHKHILCTNTFCAHTALPSQSVALQHRDTKIWLLESTISPVTKSRAS